MPGSSGNSKRAKKASRAATPASTKPSSKRKKKGTPQPSSESVGISRSERRRLEKSSSRSKRSKQRRKFEPVLERVRPGFWRPLVLSPGTHRAALMFSWIEQTLKIRTKSGKIQPLHLNEAQEIHAQYVAWCWHQRLPVRVIDVKARQLGVSTFWVAVGLARVIFWDARGDCFRHALVAHNEESSEKIFGICHAYMQHLPAEWDRDLRNKQMGEVVWSSAGGSMWINTMKSGDDLLKGPTVNMLHFSEVASFAAEGHDPEQAYTSSMGALADDENSIVVLESTAKGRDAFFFVMQEESMNGENNYTTIFTPWFLMADYSMTWKRFREEVMANPRAKDPGERFIPTPEELQLRRTLEDTVVEDGSELTTYRVRLTNEQLIWRRHTIRTKCSGKIEYFRRYYPSFLEEAFLSTTHSLFTPDTVEYYHQTSKDPKLVGILDEYRGVRFTPDSAGKIRVWEKPNREEVYVIGADPSEGGPKGDYSAAYVINYWTCEIAAAFHARVSFDHFAEQLMLLGKWYGNAKLIVDNTGNPSVANELHRSNYPNLYYYLDDIRARAGQPGKPGYNLNVKTRKIVMSKIEQYCRSRILVGNDVGLAMEMGTFTWNESRKRYQASGGKRDDRVMALAIALPFLPEGKEREEAEEVKHDPVYEDYLKDLAAERREARSRRRGVMFL